ncbi:MAG: hypothetical protein R2784_15440 [Saprospiraceae bacterium]
MRLDGIIDCTDASKIRHHLLVDYYDVNTLIKIIKRSAGILNIPISPDGAAEIASRSRGTPRITKHAFARDRGL